MIANDYRELINKGPSLLFEKKLSVYDTENKVIVGSNKERDLSAIFIHLTFKNIYSCDSKKRPVSIPPLATVCLVCNVQLTEVLSSPSRWLWEELVDVLCVWSTIWQPGSQGSGVERQRYSGEVREYIIFWCKISSQYRTPKLLKLIHFLCFIQNIKMGVFQTQLLGIYTNEIWGNRRHTIVAVDFLMQPTRRLHLNIFIHLKMI